MSRERIDLITDFNRSEGDKIDLSTLGYTKRSELVLKPLDLKA